MREEVRRVMLLVVAIGGWLSALVITAWTIVNYDDPYSRPHWVTLAVIILMGAGIAAGAAVGRMNNVRTLAKVFNAGMYAQDERDQKRRDDK